MVVEHWEDVMLKVGRMTWAIETADKATPSSEMLTREIGRWTTQEGQVVPSRSDDWRMKVFGMRREVYHQYLWPVNVKYRLLGSPAPQTTAPPPVNPSWACSR